MSVADVDELLFRYDKLKSIGNSGSIDNWLTTEFRLSRIFRWGTVRALRRKTYDLPVSQNLIRGEIRFTLTIIKRLHQIHYLRTNKTDRNSQIAIEILSKYVDATSKPHDPLKKLTTILKSLASFIPGILSFLFQHQQNDVITSGLILMGFISIPIAISFVSLELSSYILEFYWYRKWMKYFDIVKLKEKIMEDLIQLNNRTFSSFNDQ